MKQVCKYTLAPVITLEMPKGAKVLTVREQGNDICLWALVSPDADKEHRKFITIRTNHNIPEPHEGPQLNLEYCGSASLSGALIFHVFESI